MGNILQKSEVEGKITDFLIKQFSEIISEEAKESGLYKIFQVKLKYTIGLDSKILEEVQTLDDYFASCFFDCLCDLIQKEDLADTINRSEFHLSDKEFVAFLKGQDVDIVMGAKYALQPMSHKYDEVIEDFLNKKTHLFVDCWNNSLLMLKGEMLKLYFCTTKISSFSDSSQKGGLNITIPFYIETVIDKDGNKPKLLVNDSYQLVDCGIA